MHIYWRRLIAPNAIALHHVYIFFRYYSNLLYLLLVLRSGGQLTDPRN
jgi:hypothetical protein